MKNLIYKTEGIILKRTDLGEADRSFIIYTREYGKIQARARSVRKQESKLKGFLEPLTHSVFALAKSRTVDIITDIEPINIFPRLRANLESLNKACYVASLADKLIVGPEQDEALWQLLLSTFIYLDENKELGDFEEKFLEVLGYGTQAERQGEKAGLFINKLLQ